MSEMTFEELVGNLDPKQLQQQVKEKSDFITAQRHKLQLQIDQKISSIILVKKRKLDYMDYTQAASTLKLFLTSAKNLIDVYFDLLDDQEKLIVFNLSDIKDLLSKIKFCLFRSVHNMNRLIIKQNQNALSDSKPSQQETVKKAPNPSQKKKKRKKGKNSKMSIEQTGCMYQWILQNFDNPYPSQQQKQKLSADSKISISKVNYWFINMRQRTLKKFMSGQNSGYSRKKRTDKSSLEKDGNSEESISDILGHSSQESSS